MKTSSKKFLALVLTASMAVTPVTAWAADFSDGIPAEAAMELFTESAENVDVFTSDDMATEDIQDPAYTVPQDGTYTISVETGEAMFKVVNCVLTVKDGTMSADVTLSGTGYDYLYLGTSEAAQTDSAAWIASKGEEEYLKDGVTKTGFVYQMPVSALDTAIDVAAHSIKKDEWYARTLTFVSDTIKSEAPAPTPTPVEKKEQIISAKDQTKTMGAKAFSLGASLTEGEGTLTYSSDNKKVANVSGEGKVTIKGVGSAKITIKAGETDNYKEAVKVITITVNPKETKLTGVKNTSSKKMTVTWKKQNQATGYQIQYSANANFSKASYANVNKKSTVKAVVSKLTKGKKYYVRIRTYKTVNKKKYYSSWSLVKSVTIKK